MGPNPSMVQYPTGFTGSHQQEGYCPLDEESSSAAVNNRLTHFGYASVWGARGLNGQSPQQRIGHCSVYIPNLDSALIAYGVNRDGELLDDFWLLNLQTCSWKQINVDRSKISARTGARAVLFNNNIWIFGGYRNKEYVSDLHVINIDSGQVARPQATGPGPMACAACAMAAINDKIVVFGGFNGVQLSQYCILDLRTMEWKSITTGPARYGMSFAVCNESLYMFGGSQLPGVMKLDIEHEGAELLTTKGSSPLHTITKASMVSVDRFLVFIGGEPPMNKALEECYSPVYAFDVVANEWFIFHVIPDGHTVTLADGIIDNSGVFKLPVCSDSTAVYRPKQREIVIFLGQPYKDPPVLIVLHLGSALSVLNNQIDLVETLRKG